MIYGLLNKIRALIRYVKYDGKITNLTLSQISSGQILSGKKIVVTGGTSGIGLAMAKKFLSEGAEVLITGRNIQKLESVKQELIAEIATFLASEASNGIVGQVIVCDGGTTL